MAKILLVDDSKTTRTILKYMLQNEGYEVIESRDGLSGYDTYFAEKPDVVLMDITMPILDGIESLKKIKEKDPDAKIIILSSNAKKDRITEAVTYGAKAYLFKPIVEPELKSTLKTVLNSN